MHISQVPDACCSSHTLLYLQVIVFQDQKSIGRLLRPRIDVALLPAAQAPLLSPAAGRSGDLSVQIVTLIYDIWQPLGLNISNSDSAAASSPATAGAPRPSLGAARQVHIPLDAAFKGSDFRLQIIGRHDDRAFALPFPYHFSGKTAFAAVDQHLQRLEYVRRQHSLHQKEAAAGEAAPRLLWDQEECTVDCGACTVPGE